MFATNCLVVDDVKTSRMSAQIHLEQLKFKVFSASNTAECIDMLTKEDVHLVFMDWHLGAESGLKLCTSLKSQYGDKLHIIMMSGVEDKDGSEAEALSAGASAFMRKPTTIGAIIESLIIAKIEFIR